MKLATLKDRTRDGMLVVVSRDLTRCVSARPIATTTQKPDRRSRKKAVISQRRGRKGCPR